MALTTAYHLPTPVAEDVLQHAADAIREPRTRLSFALAAVHALGSTEQRSLLLDNLDRSQGRLTVRRPERADRVIHLDGFTSAALTTWLTERHRLWPTCTNPHLLVTRRTAADNPPTRQLQRHQQAPALHRRVLPHLGVASGGG